MAKIAKNSHRGGSKPGERRGGRKKGTRNKKTEAFVASIEASGLTPLDYMLKVMRTEPSDDMKIEDRIFLTQRRDDMAKAAAPYVHARLSSTEITNKPFDLSKLSDAEFEQLGKLLRLIEADNGGLAGGTGAPPAEPAPRGGRTIN